MGRSGHLPASRWFGAPERGESPRPTVLRWRCSGTTVALVHAVVLGDLLHRAAVGRLARIRRVSDGWAVIGRGPDGEPLREHRHAHWLSLTGLDDDYRVTTVAAWAPGGYDVEETAALASLSMLHGTVGGRPCTVHLELTGVGDSPSVLGDLARPARTWRTLTPYAPPSHPRPGQTLRDHVARYLQRDLGALGYDPPVSIRLIGPEGIWRSFQSRRPREPEQRARSVFGVEMTFESAVAGPIVLGALRHYGLGVFWPRKE
ncbi:type I-G CRISPR-associated protein Csb2 [Aciditerrimonas ferrireducens]|uniref:type I-G CRISPR-associated protein Csb2 n=1 Tax=Aciditerrimonas ferrireducens TaxID=667306 RepID=UPI002006CD3B|nr:type I-U CRISPR-associated protein Csb2 [Aciditerrimonas ferrireducens]MCK4176169.1 type I-U CRISPR-associated protein Csb2 [Aciditerrimonas ferrireducens]